MGTDEVLERLVIPALPPPLRRQLTVIAQDPSIVKDGRILTASIDVPREALGPGPTGYRVRVVDFDASTDTLVRPAIIPPEGDDFARATDRALLNDPHFHAQNVYAIVMHILARFEFALGRRVAWSFGGHQLKVLPHAFVDANACYSKEDQALFFGYFRAAVSGEHVYTCLSHDIVAHETTHALLDGLRARYTDPSSPDQAAFHEGFADVVALLSVFAQSQVIDALLAEGTKVAPRTPNGPRLIERKKVTRAALLAGPLLALGEQMGTELRGSHRDALRTSTELLRGDDPSKLMSSPEFEEPHRRGEIFVAAMLGFFVRVWEARLENIADFRENFLDRRRVVEEGANIADHILTIAIRALDYAPPVDLRFADYLSALLTADAELFEDDGKYRFRKHVRDAFADFGIKPAAGSHDGTWFSFGKKLSYQFNHFEPLQRDADEVFRFVWENRRKLEIHPRSYCKVISVRPAVRQGPDGFFLRETVAEYLEILTLRANELRSVTLYERPRRDHAGARKKAIGNLEPPESLLIKVKGEYPEVTLYGGGTLIFDEFGRLKYQIKNHIDSPRQQSRLEALERFGFFEPGGARAWSFAGMHIARATGMSRAASRKETF